MSFWHRKCVWFFLFCKFFSANFRILRLEKLWKYRWQKNENSRHFPNSRFNSIGARFNSVEKSCLMFSTIASWPDVTQKYTKNICIKSDHIKIRFLFRWNFNSKSLEKSVNHCNKVESIDDEFLEMRQWRSHIFFGRGWQ